MFFYARPWAVICPTCETVCSQSDQRKVACMNKDCRQYRRWFELQLPLISAHACPEPTDLFGYKL